MVSLYGESGESGNIASKGIEYMWVVSMEYNIDFFDINNIKKYVFFA